jgi:carboxyl-terminal processing protease
MMFMIRRNFMIEELSSEATPRRLILQLAATAAASFILPGTSNAELPVEEPAKLPALSDGVSTFDGVWQTVRDRFYDPHLNGLDWLAVRERYRAVAAEATSNARLAEVINDMLSELHASHTRYYTSDEPEYYQLADIFAGGLRRRGLDRAFPGGRISYPGIGVLSRPGVSAGSLITGVVEGTPAEKAGLLAGDEIVSADGERFEPVQSFRDKVDKHVVLELHRAGTVQQLPVTPVEIEPNKMFLEGMRASARVFQANGRHIGYVHVWSYAGYAYQEELERLLSDGILRDADALIWDLRDGWGGAVPQYLDLFNPRAPTMRVTDRLGAHEFENVKWRKPVAMLINGGTRSGKEVLAYGFKKYQLGEVIGTQTEGAVLAATAFLIGRGLLLLAVDDVQVDGERLEGVGVAPTIEVQPAFGERDDPQLNRALALLSA